MRSHPAEAEGLHVIVPYGPRGASARVRAFDWLNHTGVKAEVHDYLGLPVNTPAAVLRHPSAALLAEAHLWRLAREVSTDTVFLVREASPFSRGHVEAAILRRAARAVYDFDDALMLQEPGLVAHLASKAAKWRRCVSRADVVIAGNDMLAEAAASAGARDIRLIPSCVEPNAYRRKVDYSRSGPPRAVWLGSPTTETYVEQVAKPLLHAHHSTGLRLSVISGGERSLGLLDTMVDRIAWTPAAHDTLADYDFGIMPLPDDIWSRGKCAYKLLQYGAAGLPMIGTPVGANQAALAVMGGLDASDDDEWRDALAALSVMPPAQLADLGRSAREGVVKHYSFGVWAPTWLDAVCGNNG